MITPYNVLRHELVGLPVKAHVGKSAVEGTVEEETEKTFKVKTPTGVKTVVKASSRLEFTLPLDAVVEVDGKLLCGAPEDRIKKKHRIRY